MYRIFYPERDTTLYERFPDQNTGIDQILELTKHASGSVINGRYHSDTYNTRFLIDFGTEVDKLISSVNSNKIPPIGRTANSASVYLSIRSSDATDLLQKYILYAFPVSQSWSHGQGNANDNPKTTLGASWNYRDNIYATKWDTGSAGSSGDMSATITSGGGTWITGSTYEASQSFENQVPDIRIDVTDIVDHWVKGDIDNNGFIIKRSHTDENSGAILGSIKFFSRESHTIFVPKLEVVWNNTTFADTGSAEISTNSYVPYFKNIKSEYRTSEITKFRIGVRSEFPTKTYTTSSFYLTNNRLPTSSYYSIIDSITNEIIIANDTLGTQIDCDVNGSFFKLRMDSFMPERYYKIQLKIERDGGDDIQTFDDFYFKVVN
tara:strand:- start:8250 stop:9383 length:1134 start_codon:yes stop_codon:yes gene_type:complete